VDPGEYAFSVEEDGHFNLPYVPAKVLPEIVVYDDGGVGGRPVLPPGNYRLVCGENKGWTVEKAAEK
jgi:hypothetical protein